MNMAAGGGNQADRNDYNISASETAQANFERIAGLLETALTRRDTDVKQAMASYQADGVSDQYAGVEKEWNMAGIEIRGIITSLRNSLADNDDVARRALSMAASYVPGA